MSALPIREALRRLDGLGLVEHVPHRGARVKELSLEDLHDLYDARLHLETMVIRRAAGRFTDEAASLARTALAEEQEAENRNDRMAAWMAHTRFHFALYEQCGSTWLLRLITPLWESSQRYRMRLTQLEEDLPHRRAQHDRILAACVAHDAPRAEKEIRNHLVQTADLSMRAMGGKAVFSRHFKRSRASATPEEST